EIKDSLCFQSGRCKRPEIIDLVFQRLIFPQLSAAHPAVRIIYPDLPIPNPHKNDKMPRRRKISRPHAADDRVSALELRKDFVSAHPQLLPLHAENRGALCHQSPACPSLTFIVSLLCCILGDSVRGDASVSGEPCRSHGKGCGPTSVYRDHMISIDSVSPALIPLQKERD